MPPMLTTAPMTDTIVVQSISPASFLGRERRWGKLRWKQFGGYDSDSFCERDNEFESHSPIPLQGGIQTAVRNPRFLGDCFLGHTLVMDNHLCLVAEVCINVAHMSNSIADMTKCRYRRFTYE